MRTNATRPEAGQPAPHFDVEFFNGYEWEDKQVSDLEDMAGNEVRRLSGTNVAGVNRRKPAETITDGD